MEIYRIIISHIKGKGCKDIHATHKKDNNFIN